MIPRTELLDRGWMSPPGNYQAFIESLAESDPRLRRADKKWQPDGPARAVVIEFPESAKANARSHQPVPTIFYDAEQLNEYFIRKNNNTSKTNGNTIYILEGLNRHTIEIMGEHFKLHPSIFLDYVRSVQVPGCKKGHSSLLASTWAARDHLVMSYREVLSLDEEAASFPHLRCIQTGRDIATTRVNGNLDCTGLLHRKAVFWTRQREVPQGGWDCKLRTRLSRKHITYGNLHKDKGIVICDPPVQAAQDSSTGTKLTLLLKGGHRLDGYMDFVPTSAQVSARRGPPRTCLADDLAFYVTTHSKLVDGIYSPDAVALFVKKIIASHYSQVFDYIRGHVHMRVCRSYVWNTR